MLREFSGGDRRLVAYVVAKNRDGKEARNGEAASGQRPPPYVGGYEGLDVGELRNYLKAKLPDYMVPSVIEMLERLPLTPNGKVDRKALPAPSSVQSGTEQAPAAAQTDVEKRIAAIWKTSLRTERIGLHDNFFDLGGHSLLVMQVHAQLCEAFRTDLPILRLFQYPTVNSLAKFLSEEQKEKVSFQKIRDRARLQKGAFAARKQPREAVL